MRRSQAPSNVKRARTSKFSSAAKSSVSKMYKKVPIVTPSRVLVGRQAMPPQFSNTIKYSEFVNMSMVNGLGSYVVSQVSLFKPNITGTGTQPLYFDQLAAIYNHYVVMSARIEIRLHSVPTSGAYGIITLYTDDDNTVGSNAVESMTRPGAVSKSFSSFLQVAEPLYGSYSAVKLFGPNPLGNTKLLASVTAAPSETSNWVFQVYDNNVVTSNITQFITMKVEYDVIWTERKTIAVS